MLRYNCSNEKEDGLLLFLGIYSLEKLSWDEIVRMNKDEDVFFRHIA